MALRENLRPVVGVVVGFENELGGSRGLVGWLVLVGDSGISGRIIV